MTDSFLSGLLGGLVGVGLLIAWFGIRGHALFGTRGSTKVSRVAQLDRMALRIAGAMGLGIVAGLLTRWVAVVVTAAVAGFLLPSMSRIRGRHQRELAKVEALATWIEQVRDTLSAANGLEHAIAATGPLAPAEIGPAVERLAARLSYENGAVALRRFADEVDHPLADFVVAALVAATEYQARDLTPLLGELATAARSEASMRTRVWVGRARTRTAVRVIGIVIVLMVVGLNFLDPNYMSAYSNFVGQIVLSIIVLMFVGSLMAMDRMGRIALPERFIARRDLTEGDQPW
jgi:tight adherence protein B